MYNHSCALVPVTLKCLLLTVDKMVAPQVRGPCSPHAHAKAASQARFEPKQHHIWLHKDTHTSTQSRPVTITLACSW
jgi:hypothetical protein